VEKRREKPAVEIGWKLEEEDEHGSRVKARVLRKDF